MSTGGPSLDRSTGTDADLTRSRYPSWAAPVSSVLCVLGLLDAAYLTYEHFTQSTTLACSESATINCLKVTTSSYAVILGVPVAVLGLVFFVAMTALCLPAAWRRPGPTGQTLMRLRILGCAVGVVSALYLVGVELFGVDAICLWCTGVHVLTFALLVTVLLAAVSATPGDDPS